MKKQIIYCDICKKEGAATKQNMQVIFTTEQNEGRSVKPYFDRGNVDMCSECYQKALDGNYVYATGAMGYNEYYFKRNPELLEGGKV